MFSRATKRSSFYLLWFTHNDEIMMIMIMIVTITIIIIIIIIMIIIITSIF